MRIGTMGSKIRKQGFLRFGIKGIIVRDGKVLLIRRSNYNNYRAGEWDMPGGRLEKDEGAFDGHRREVMEEAGITVDIIEPVRTWYITREGVEHVGITLLNKHKSGNVVLSNEHTEHKWLFPNEIKSLENTPDWVKDDIGLAVELNPSIFAKPNSNKFS